MPVASSGAGLRATAAGGAGLALIAAALFGVSARFAKLLLAGATPQLLAGLLYLGSGIGLAVVWLRRRAQRRTREASLTRRDLPWLVIILGGVALSWEGGVRWAELPDCGQSRARASVGRSITT